MQRDTIELRSGQDVVVLMRFGALSGPPPALRDPGRALTVLSQAVTSPDGMRRLRSGWARLNRSSLLSEVSNTELLRMVTAAIRSGHVEAVVRVEDWAPKISGTGDQIGVGGKGGGTAAEQGAASPTKSSPGATASKPPVTQTPQPPQAPPAPPKALPKGFPPSVEDPVRRALDAFPNTEAGDIAKQLKGKTLDEIKAFMDSKYPNAVKAATNLKPPPGQAQQVLQTKWELPDGTVVRVKETIPPGGKVDKFRQEPSLSISALKREANGQIMPESYPNEAFKVSSDGVPVPKGPNEIDTSGLTPAAKDKLTNELMAAGHQSIPR